jgi:DNA polymerase II large subunit
MGGSRRNLLETIKRGSIQVEISLRKCPECKIVTHKPLCDNCGIPTRREKICPNCKRVLEEDFCPSCKRRAVGYQRQTINVKKMFQEATKKLGIQSPPLVKGVRGLTNVDKTPETIEKGILRAKHDLYVFKDGTTRFDMTDAPLTHFKPSEIEASVDKIRTLGYLHDVKGGQLVDTEQTCELKVQDVIVSASCGDYLTRVAQFLDELLIRVYNLPPYYNVKTRQDLVGNLVIGLAPHTSAGVLGRIIGFTKAKVCYAHPLWHNVKRRDCDGDEDSVMLVLDVLLNFSRSYLPARIGGMMDAPLLIISIINPFEVDEALNVDVAAKYPLTFYNNTLKKNDPTTISNVIDTVSKRLGTPAQFEGYSFTHPTTNINGQNWESEYLKLGAMTDKLKGQLTLAEKIRAVDAKEVAMRVLTTHFIRDIAGNLKAFTGQRFRCKKCNKKYRRIPVVGICTRCGGDLTQTVYRGGIEKYLDGAEGLVQQYRLADYYHQRIDLIKDEIESIFNIEAKQKVKQAKLSQFT